MDKDKTMTNKEIRENVETLTHEEARRKNIPTAEYQSVMQKEEQSPVRVAYERGAAGLEKEKAGRNRDLDPQLLWRGKDEQDWSELVVHAPPSQLTKEVAVGYFTPNRIFPNDSIGVTSWRRQNEVLGWGH
jgi:adenine-specific DNA-methyltransferase